MPTKLQKARKKTENFSAGPNSSANLATSGAARVMTMTANQT